MYRIIDTHKTDQQDVRSMEEVEHPVDSRGYDRHRAEHALSSGDGTVQMALDFLQAKCRYQNV